MLLGGPGLPPGRRLTALPVSPFPPRTRALYRVGRAVGGARGGGGARGAVRARARASVEPPGPRPCPPPAIPAGRCGSPGRGERRSCRQCRRLGSARPDPDTDRDPARVEPADRPSFGRAMAERGCPLEAVPLPAEVRESLAELELELSEGERPGAWDPRLPSSQTPARPSRPNPDPRQASGARRVAALWVVWPKAREPGRGSPFCPSGLSERAVPAEGCGSAPWQPRRLQPRVPRFPPLRRGGRSTCLSAPV